ncbi:hypothetical protein M3Y98_01114100 [Aphelenchoides besseyi]|nr:hypothetical protein M3Y98_01114100 [Aphelenchoides besseyi]KAI6209189.1 hypothetical protein M3Y96_00195100 [Aphelenchoides besseyi]
MGDEIFVLVSYDYVAQDNQHELTIRKGERLKVLDDSFNWWKVLNERGESGLVPSNFLRRESFIDRAKGTFGIGKSRSRSSIPTELVDSSTTIAADPTTRNPLNNTHSSLNTQKMPDIISYAIAKFTYEPQRDDELRLAKNDHLSVLDKSSDGWWKGELNGSTGWFPSNYVEETNSPPPSALPTAPPSAINQNTNGFGAMNYGGNIDSGYPLQNSSFTNGSTNREQVLEVVVALYSFDAQNAEELSFRKGERLDIIDHPAYDPDWYKARNANGEIGLVPTNYIEIVERNPNGIRATTSVAQKSYSGPQLSGPYAQQPWYFGALSREQSDFELNARGMEGDFLVRDSESNPGDYSISLKGNIRNKHFWIQVDVSSSSYKIGNRTFPTMQALIQHYTKAPIFSSEETGERLYLVRPLPRN